MEECLNIIVIGLSHNTTAESGECLPFVYISVSPLVYVGKKIEWNKNEEESDGSEIEEKPIIKPARWIIFIAQLRNIVKKLRLTQVLYFNGTHQA